MGAHSSQAHMHYIDVDTEWDHDDCPLTQPSLHSQLDEARAEYKEAAYAAPASPPGAVVAQQLEAIASPFVMARSSPAYEQQPRAARAPKPKPHQGSSSSSSSTSTSTSTSTSAHAKPKAKPKANKRKSRSWEPCGACDKDVVMTSPCIVLRGIGCCSCGVLYHLQCQDLEFMPKHGSFMCVGCKKAM